MNGGEQDLDRNEQATPYKLEEARKRGSIARSTDASTLAIMLVALISSFALLAGAVSGAAHLLARGLATSPDTAKDSTSAVRLMTNGLHEGLLIIAPILLGLFIMAVLSGLFQSGGLVFSTTPLKPDLNRLNPVLGLKRFFSVRVLYEAGKSTLKLLALVAVAGVALKTLLVGALRLASLPEKSLLFRILDASGGLLAKLWAVLLLFALVDLLFTRWDFLRNLRMSKREIEYEHKNREGDPRIRRRQREIRMQFLQRSRAIKQVPQASVVITNPTHIAIALKYEHGVTPAPTLLAKGAGLLALRIRWTAYRAGVPIVHSPRLARALYKEVQQDAYVPQQWYPAVARILIWLRTVNEARGAAERRPA